MIYLKDFRQGKLLYEALDSDVRLGILDELVRHGELNLAYFAKRFGVSNGAITAHAKKLHAAGLIEITTSSGVRGTQKICRPATDKIIVDLLPRPREEGRVTKAEIGVGHFVDYAVSPTCGIATRERVIGGFDDPSFFSYPDRFNAGILWFAKGYVEYLLPAYFKDLSKLREIRISMELASEAPGYAAYYPSDIRFSLCGVPVGVFTSKGEYNDRAGACNPAWWYGNLGQYGKKAVLTVGRDGSFINGVRASNVGLSALRLQEGGQIRFRISVPEEGENCGGVTLFGSGFGDYEEGVVCEFVCED